MRSFLEFFLCGCSRVRVGLVFTAFPQDNDSIGFHSVRSGSVFWPRVSQALARVSACSRPPRFPAGRLRHRFFLLSGFSAVHPSPPPTHHLPQKHPPCFFNYLFPFPPVCAVPIVTAPHPGGFFPPSPLPLSSHYSAAGFPLKRTFFHLTGYR